MVTDGQIFPCAFLRSQECVSETDGVVCKLLSLSAFSPGEFSSYTTNTYEARVLIELRKKTIFVSENNESCPQLLALNFKF